MKTIPRAAHFSLETGTLGLIISNLREGRHVSSGQHVSPTIEGMNL